MYHSNFNNALKTSPTPRQPFLYCPFICLPSQQGFRQVTTENLREVSVQVSILDRAWGRMWKQGHANKVDNNQLFWQTMEILIGHHCQRLLLKINLFKQNIRHLTELKYCHLIGQRTVVNMKFKWECCAIRWKLAVFVQIGAYGRLI